MRFDLISYLSETFLFSGIEKKDIKELINNTEFEIAEFNKRSC